MKKLARIGPMAKKIYRLYTAELLSSLQKRGFADLRPSFLEVLFYICENPGPSIKLVGEASGLKKQTMTSHVNELERRGYVVRKTGQIDRREQTLYLTEYGEKFKLALRESMEELEQFYAREIGEVELDRIDYVLTNFFNSIVVVGFMSIFLWHTFINMGMVTGIIPIVGVPLPFMSYGGTSLLTFGICNGIITSMSNSRNIF